MAGISSFLGLVRGRFGCIAIIDERQFLGLLKLPLLGCVISLGIGCSTVSHDPVTANHPAASSQLAGTPAADLQMQGANLAAKPPKWELPVPDQTAVDNWVLRFRWDKHNSFQTQLDRARHYVVPTQKIFEQTGLPKDLVYVALIESGFTPTARSHASAVGMWQFISSTGKRFGLAQNRWIDERRHPFKSARAAAEYLSFLFDTFGSWELALAAYNAGENGVQAALDQSGAKTFWELARRGYLPAETCEYVPKFYAAVKIIRNPHHYGFYFDPKRYDPKNETVAVPGGVKLSWLGKKTGIPEETLRNQNPELIRPLTPPWCSVYELCVPIGTGETVMTALSETPPPSENLDGESVGVPSRSESPEPVTTASVKPEPHHPLTPAVERSHEGDANAGKHKSATPALASYTVKAHDTLFSLARRYGCSARELAALNGMSPSQPIKVGETIRVPGQEPIEVASAKREVPQKSSVHPADGKKAARSEQKAPQAIHYPVRHGDTLDSIAKRFGVSIDRLCAHNQLNKKQKLMPGSVLTIYTKDQETKYTMQVRPSR